MQSPAATCRRRVAHGAELLEIIHIAPTAPERGDEATRGTLVGLRGVVDVVYERDRLDP